ncbi:MAG: hypothetical protein IIC82_09140 [Chloroflexi bacterium]|nr:hypothetical protein [Chloroflexota bacterium]
MRASLENNRLHKRRGFRWGHAWIVGLVALTLLVSACSRDVTVIGILEPDRGPAVKEARTGFLDALDEAGFRASENVRFLRRNAEFRDEPLADLARDLVENEEVDFLFAIGSDALAAAIEAAPDQRVFFALSGDPLVGGVAEPRWRHDAIAVGAAAFPATADLVNVARRLLPELTSLTVIFDADDLDSVAAKDLAVEGAARIGLSLVVMPVDARQSAEAAAVRAISEGTQGLLLAPARTLEQAMGEILETAFEAGIPVFAWREEHVERGALVAQGIDVTDNGKRAGVLAARVLEGQAVSGNRVTLEASYFLWLSGSVADRLGISIPADLEAQATAIVE